MKYKTTFISSSRKWTCWKLITFVTFFSIITALHAHKGYAQTRVPKNVVDLSIWKTNWKEKYSGNKRTENLVYTEFLTEMYKQNPGMDPAQAMEEMRKFRAEYDRRINRGQDDSYEALKSKHETILILFEVAEAVGGKVAGVTRKVYERLMTKWAFPELDAATQVLGTMRRWEKFEDTRRREDEILNGAIAQSKDNQRFSTAFDMLFGPELNASIKDAADNVIRKNPQINIPPKIKNNIQPDGTLIISIQELKDLTINEFKNMNDTLSDIRTTLKSIDEKQNFLVAYVLDEQRRREAKELEERKRAEYQLKISAAESSIFILSTFASFVDPKLGKEIYVIGNSSIQIVDSVKQYLETASKLGEITGSLSTMVLTGNVLGAVMNVVALFADQGPSPDQMILDAIGDLRNQVNNLRSEMHERFDRIDIRLNIIYNTLAENFAYINIITGRIDANVVLIQKELVRIESTLNRMERNMQECFDAEHRKDFMEAINGAIDYKERTSIDMPYSEFVNYENKFHAWGTIFSFDPINAGPMRSSYSDDMVKQELDYPIDYNINYLVGWLNSKDILPFFDPDSRLPSPRDWSLASTVYSALSFDWPRHTRRISPDRKAQLDQIGVDLKKAIRRISTIDTPNGPQGNLMIFYYLISYYKDKAKRLYNEIQSVEETFSREIIYGDASKLKRDEKIDGKIGFWGNIYQSLKYTPQGCLKMNRGLNAPSNIKNFIPNTYILADYLYEDLHDGTVETSFSGAEWVDFEDKQVPHNYLEILFAKLKVTVDVRFNNTLIHRRVFTSGKDKIGETKFDSTGEVVDSWVKDANEEAIKEWERGNLKEAFENRSVEVVPSSEEAITREVLLQNTIDKVEDKLYDYQKKTYNEVVRQISSGSLRKTALEFGGAKVLIDMFVTLGLQRAIETDDYLRGFLYGNQHLYNDELVELIYENPSLVLHKYTMPRRVLRPDSWEDSPGGPPVGLPVGRITTFLNIRSIIQGQTDDRINALEKLLHEYLDKIGKKTYREIQPFIENVQMRLNISDRLARQNP